MKKAYALAISALLLFTSCNKDTGNTTTTTSSSSSGCGTHNGKALHRGPDGGCYYINSNGNKSYVDRSECRCP